MGMGIIAAAHCVRHVMIWLMFDLLTGPVIYNKLIRLRSAELHQTPSTNLSLIDWNTFPKTIVWPSSSIFWITVDDSAVQLHANRAVKRCRQPSLMK